MQEAQLLICATVKDLPWLNACLKSVQKFWTGTHNPVIVLTPECRNALPGILTELRAYVVFVAASLHPYVRLTADCYMTGQLVVFLDSHDMFTRSCSIGDLMQSGRPTLTMEPYFRGLCRPNADANCVEVRRSHIEDLTGILPEFEYTARSPLVFHRYSIRRLREAIEIKNKRPLRDLILNYCPDYFSEFNFLASYCHDKENSQYDWVFADKPYRPMLKQFFGITDPTRGEDFEEVQRILNN